MGIGFSRTSTSKKTLVMSFHDSKKWTDHLDNSTNTNKLMVVDFFASWCGPCRKMEPIFNELAERYTDIEFIRINVDELKDVAREFGIESMPTFIMLRSGKEIDKVVGANRNKLEKMIEKHRG
ncbi:hypothetical protein M9H77_10049 [Catharanthus roseus]|uniref:Uncharacterized protein n=1 Tax=Catharanthus roseus TaxID=4058 RepID=A0ACC0C2D0_CATRO|nr:hypothetical protein M9H77_10049 [Catharanthus roseus]